MDGEENKQNIKEFLDEQILKVKRGEPIGDKAKAFRKEVERQKETIRDCYYMIKDTLRQYIDMREDYYNLVALWIMGTYAFEQFQSYPYLFLNAMRGSGKTRALNLITNLAYKGRLMVSPTEAVLFRTKGTLALDEVERIASKDKAAIREMLNASYKKGMKVYRMKKKKTMQGEEQVMDEFEPYKPLLMANIWGMDEVLGDRCISIVLEKSEDLAITKLTEEFEGDENIQKVRTILNQCSLCSVVSIYKTHNYTWNKYILDKYKTTHTTYITTQTQTTQTTTTKKRELNNIIELYNKIDESGIDGRNLELFFPLFFLSKIISEDIVRETIQTAKKISEEKEKEAQFENKDLILMDFIAERCEDNRYYYVTELTKEFEEYINEDMDWLNSKWLGRALKRLNLLTHKRRAYRGIEVMINVDKAKKKVTKDKKNLTTKK